METAQAVKIFEYSGQMVRVYPDQQSNLFVATDICDLLAIENTSQAVAELDDDEKYLRSFPSSLGPRDMLFVTESGLYALIFKSRKPEAKAFRRWVTGEVLPSIRKTGGFGQWWEAYREARTGMAQVEIIRTIRELTFRSALAANGRPAVRLKGAPGLDAGAVIPAEEFWLEVLHLFDAGGFGLRAQELEFFFKAHGRDVAHPPGAPNQGPWRSYRLCLNPNGVLDRMKAHGNALDRTAVRLGLNGEPCWRTEADSRQRFGMRASSTQSWEFDLDSHPLGYQAVSDEVYASAREFQKANGDAVFHDPRQGPLFRIVEALERQG